MKRVLIIQIEVDLSSGDTLIKCVSEALEKYQESLRKKEAGHKALEVIDYDGVTVRTFACSEK